MSVIDDFIQQYEREFDFYDKVCRKAELQLDELLSDAGIRAIVTSRAKSPSRLAEKIRQRNVTKTYNSKQDIYLDIPDLAGVRIALYFPDANLEVDRIIKDSFELINNEKVFPEPGKKRKTGNRVNRFSGYFATHYRVKLKCNDSNKTIYHDAPIEIQVASVLMHAWSEVEHDLVYKPLSGNLSDEEYAILDEINGLVLSGEIALERLKHAAVVRTSKGNKPFDNQYELAAAIIDVYGDIYTKKGQKPPDLSNIGRVNVLLDKLVQSNNNTHKKLKEIIERVFPETKPDVPFAESIIAFILDENPSLMSATSISTKNYQLLNGKVNDLFVNYKLDFFKRYEELFELVKNSPLNSSRPKPAKGEERRMTIPQELVDDFLGVRETRNKLAHGRDVDLSEIAESYELMDELKAKIEALSQP
ncbi:GTP pyrophosphokinase [Pectobacterium zantedeschiae]|uniref:GTP pyrophosphokinase n=1 Tax=Pectobacterium zantedeschiae TaxID=2034769 RepID=UPI0013EAC3D2|nr:RelA/SpoT domain-containing protein [Pectobacterium zantedeschiae]